MLKQVPETAAAPELMTSQSTDLRDKPSIEKKSLGANLYSKLPKRRQVGLVIILAALACCLSSFAILLGYTSYEPTGEVVIAAVSINSVFALALTYMIVREIWTLVQAQRQGRAAARMHIRIVGLFGLIASVPAIIVAVIAGVTLDRGLDRWFAERTQTIVSSSREVARAYINESARGLQTTTLQMADALNRSDRLFRLDPGGFQELFNRQTRGRGLLGASLITGEGEYIIRAETTGDAVQPDPPEGTLAVAGDGYPKLILPGDTGIVGSIIRLPNIPFSYLYTTRELDSIARRSLALMESNTALYGQLSDSRVSVQFAFAVLYIAVTLILLLSSIWMGIGFADRLVAPIRQLIGAATEVRGGNMDVHVPVDPAEGDVASLSDTFNRMILDIGTQRDEIVSARDQMDRRRRFTEAVLSGVTPGVMGVDAEGNVSIANPAARAMFGNLKTDIVGMHISDFAPKIHELFQQTSTEHKRTSKAQITPIRAGRERTWNVQVTEEASESDVHSYVITIDDITDLVLAQRDSAWGDVARRIAHEIKNPLTPIQLSAERLKRRYGRKLTEDREVFDQCTETIVRQVADIGRMVDEFSQFARMPKPSFAESDFKEAIKEAVFLREVAQPDIAFEVETGDIPLLGQFDLRLISQAIGNVVKNAAESIEAVSAENPKHKGSVRIAASDEGDFLKLVVVDNGKGLPEESRQRLLEPYMTTREKGTGLGLAIVRKIVEDHGGSVDLTDAPDLRAGETGAMVTLTIMKTHKNNFQNNNSDIENQMVKSEEAKHAN